MKQSGEIVYQYLTMAGSTLNSATIGIENQGGTVALQVVYNNNYVHNNLAVRIAADISWLTPTPVTGTVAVGDSAKVRLAYSAVGVPAGSYTGRLEINSNDYTRSPLNVPVQMNVVVAGRDIGVASLARPSAQDEPAAVEPSAFADVATASSSSGPKPVLEVTEVADTVRFRAIVRNFGTTVEPAYQVRWSVDGVVQGTLNNTDTLTVGDTDTLFFQWNTGTPGGHTARAWTLIGGDNNPANDTASTSFTIAVPGVGDTLYSFVVPNQIILGVAKMGRSNKLVFSSGGQSSADINDNKWIVTTMRGAVLDTTKPQVNPTAGQGFGFRDLAWDGRWILASDNAQIRRIDTTTFTEIASRITGPGTLQRGVAADGRNRIWKSNFTSDPVVVFDSTGATVRNYGVPTVAPYGIAVDKWSTRGRMWLWYAQPSLTGQLRLSKVDTANGSIVQTYDYSTVFPATGTVGGLDVINDHPNYPGRVIGIMVIQNYPTSVVVAIDLGRDSSTTGVDERRIAEIPADFALDQNFPNPFNPTTQISYALPEQASVSLRVYDILGREVATLVNGQQGAGYYIETWNGRTSAGSAVTSGVYFYRLEAKGVSGKAVSDIKKMVLMK